MPFNITTQHVEVRVEGNAENTLFRITWPFGTRSDWTELCSHEPLDQLMIEKHLALQPVEDPRQDTVEIVGNVHYIFDNTNVINKEYVWSRENSNAKFTRDQMRFIRRDAAGATPN